MDFPSFVLKHSHLKWPVRKSKGLSARATLSKVSEAFRLRSVFDKHNHEVSLPPHHQHSWPMSSLSTLPFNTQYNQFIVNMLQKCCRPVKPVFFPWSSFSSWYEKLFLKFHLLLVWGSKPLLVRGFFVLVVGYTWMTVKVWWDCSEHDEICQLQVTHTQIDGVRQASVSTKPLIWCPDDWLVSVGKWQRLSLSTPTQESRNRSSS